MSASAWRDAQDILCVRLDTIGDLLMTTPAIRALKESAPGRRITLLTSSAAAPAARLVPEVDDIVVYDPPWMKASPARKDAAEEYATIQELRERGLDAAAVFTVFSQNPLPAAMTCYLAEIPLRLAHCRENPYRLLTQWVREPEPERGIRHEVRRQLDLVAAVGAFTADERLSLRVPDDAAARVAAILAGEGIAPGTGPVVLHPGATAPSRTWPAARFAEVGDALAAAGLRVAVTGTAEERPLAAEVVARMRAEAADLSGRLGIAELAALIREAALLVTNNTGPAHVAAAVGTPVVDVYALTNPQHTPWQVENRVLTNPVPCGDCYSSRCLTKGHPCLSGITSEMAASAAFELLGAVPLSRPGCGLPQMAALPYTDPA